MTDADHLEQIEKMQRAAKDAHDLQSYDALVWIQRELREAKIDVQALRDRNAQIVKWMNEEAQKNGRSVLA